MMRKLLIGIGVVIALVVVLAIIAPFIVPTDSFKPRLIAAVKAATGRELAVDGRLTFHLFPTIGIEVEHARLANAPGGDVADLVTLDGLDLSLHLLALLHGEIAIDRFDLINPVINLTVDKDGQPNWSFGVGSAPQPASQPVPGSLHRSRPIDLKGLRLGMVKLVNGTVNYADERTGKSGVVSKIGATLRLPSLDDPFSLDGSAIWNDRPVALTVAIESPRRFLDGQPTPASLKLASQILTIELDGAARSGASPGFDGTLAIDIPLVRDVAAWLGHAIKMAGSGLGPFTLQAKLSAEAARLALTDAGLSLDATHGSGGITLDMTGQKPRIDGKLVLDAVDLNPYLPPASGAKPVVGEKPAEARPAHDTTADDWSDKPLDLAGLDDVDVSFALDTAALKFRKFELGQSTLTVALVGGKLTVDLTKLAAYGGSGSGTVALDGSRPDDTGLSVNASFEGVRVQSLLADAIGLDRLSGTGSLTLVAAGHGSSERAIVGTLAGKGGAHVTNGSIRGIDLSSMMRNITSAFVDTGDDQKTDFSALDATWTMNAGVMKNDDLTLTAPFAHVTGTGTVDLPQRRLHYHLEPKVNAALGQGLIIPVIVDGPWSHLSWRPDLEGLLKQNLDPGQLLHGLQGAKKPADLLNGLFGGH